MGVGPRALAAAEAALWKEQRLDILLQETKLTVAKLAGITPALRGWRRAYWCHSGRQGACGVAILVRDGPLAVDDSSVTRLGSGDDAGNLRRCPPRSRLLRAPSVAVKV